MRRAAGFTGTGMSSIRPADSFRRVVRDAILDFARHGYDSPVRLDTWLRAIERAGALAMRSPEEIRRETARTLENVYARQVERGQLMKRAPGVSRYTIDRLAPAMRQELDRRIAASADLIKLNRAQAMETTLRRFSGWATSVPPGGSRAVEKGEEAQHVRKALAQLEFTERRVAVDQGHKLVANISEVAAVGSGAIAGEWHSRWREAGYNYRKDHRERDMHVYLVPGSWAVEKGLVKPGPDGYIDQITRPSEEPFCRCSYRFIFTLRALPDSMLTARGRAALSGARPAVVA